MGVKDAIRKKHFWIISSTITALFIISIVFCAEASIGSFFLCGLSFIESSFEVYLPGALKAYFKSRNRMNTYRKMNFGLAIAFFVLGIAMFILDVIIR